MFKAILSKNGILMSGKDCSGALFKVAGVVS